ncbi:MAG TPA: tetratricopeptide repeat protein [Candidatus Angelobacter sp.]|jgi:tetratricopeptide (TPR) repeat protein|nr:tetratricopeptide repeat protein [Candidatus Angelobacter sp.]
MKTKLTYAVMTMLLFLAATTTGWSQATAGKVQGKVTDGGKPVADAQVTLTNIGTGRTFKMKTDKNGQFNGVGFPFGDYEEEVTAGEKRYKTKVQIKGEGGAVDDVSVEMSSGKPGAGPSKEEIEKLKAEREKGMSMNALIAQYNAAQTAKNWQEAADILKKMIAAEPNRWEYQKALGDMQLNAGQYQEAADTYEKVIPLAENATKTDPKADPAKAKAAVGQMLTNEGNAYLKLKKSDKAIEAFTKGAAMDSNPGTAYFNICATQYNSGNTQGALVACDKAISADPSRAEAYYIKASLMFAESKQDKDGKLQAPAGTAEAFNKYLELAPDGPHANDVKQMLNYIGAKIETTYHEKKKK